MAINETVFSANEKINFKLRELFLNAGYSPYKMSKFEEYDFYAKNKNFLVSDNVITFTDLSGKLMALKPDVTLSIIKGCKDSPNETKKVFYGENVYRVSKNTNDFKEIMQTGLECFGKISKKNLLEVISLAVKSLSTISKKFILSISDIDAIESLVSCLTDFDKEKVLKALSEKNPHELNSVLNNYEDCKNINVLKELLSLCGTVEKVAEKIKVISKKYGVDVFDNLLSIVSELDKNTAKNIEIDFSVLSDLNYYNGLVFKGFILGVPDAVLSGGQYDKLMFKLSKKSKAIGFAVYTDFLNYVSIENEDEKSKDEYLNVALPKGRLGEKVYSLFEKAGFECPSILENSRKLIFENKEKKIRYFWVKPSDVSIYVERGAADIGAVGKDILVESGADVYELFDLNMGKCTMSVAAPKGFKDDSTKTLKVATKFSNVAKTFYQGKGRDIDIIKLNGSIEIAPILGLSDVIVDIVETGTTLKENNLEVIESIFPISARIIGNKSNVKFKEKKIKNLLNALSMGEEKND